MLMLEASRLPHTSHYCVLLQEKMVFGGLRLPPASTVCALPSMVKTFEDARALYLQVPYAACSLQPICSLQPAACSPYVDSWSHMQFAACSLQPICGLPVPYAACRLQAAASCLLRAACCLLLAACYLFHVAYHLLHTAMYRVTVQAAARAVRAKSFFILDGFVSSHFDILNREATTLSTSLLRLLHPI